MSIFYPLMCIWDEVPPNADIKFLSQHLYAPVPHAFLSLDPPLRMHRTLSVGESPHGRVFQ